MIQAAIRIIATVVLAGAPPAILNAEGRATASCSSDAVLGPQLTSGIKALLLRRDTTSLAKLGLVPADTSQVMLVNDSAVCDVALGAYNAQLSQYGVQPVTGVFVLRAGPERYAVLNFANHAGEFTYYLIFDNAWTFVTRFGG